jgi:hypothetical protein
VGFDIMVQINPIRYFFGNQFDSDPQALRALEIADSVFKNSHPTHLDLTPTHKQFLVKESARLLANDEQAVQIDNDALSRGYYRGIGNDGRSSFADETAKRNAGARITELPGGECEITLPQEPTGIPVIVATSPAPTRKFSGNPDQWPGARQRREEAERRAQIRPGSKLPPGQMLGQRDDPGWKPEPGKVGRPSSFPGKLDRQLIR